METARNAGKPRPADPVAASRVDGATPVLSRDARRDTLWLLGAVFAVHLLDRQIFAILIPPIKAEFALSDTALGVLSGLAFTIFFSTIGIVIARLADRLDRARIITVSLALFSAMTALCSLASGFWSLLAARVGVGVGEGGTNPASHALIADLYPSAERATAAAVYSVGPHIGLMLAFGLGGWLAQTIGWRFTFAVAGALGLALAIACATKLRDPRTVIAKRAPTAAPPTGELLNELVTRRSFRHLIAGATLATAASLGALTWLPALLIRAHGFDLAQAGLLLAIGIGAFGAAGTYALGRLADRVAVADARRKAWVAAACQALLALAWLPVLFVSDRAAVIIALLLPCALAGAYLGPTIAMIQDVVDPRARAFCAALAILVINLIGGSAGPLALGALSDALSASLGARALGMAFLVIPALLAWSAYHYARASDAVEICKASPRAVE